MLLRSIKTANPKDDIQNLVVSSSHPLNDSSNNKNEISSVKQKNANAIDEYLDKIDIKMEGGLKTDKDGKLKKTHDLKADGINTSWNSKRKSNFSDQGIDNGKASFKNEREKNVYYPTKKKMDTSLKAISEYLYKKRSLLRSASNDLSLKKMRINQH